MASVESVREFLKGRAFSPRVQRAVVHLARDPDLSLRKIAIVHGIDPGRLCRIAALVPGLSELRPAKGGRRAA